MSRLQFVIGLQLLAGRLRSFAVGVCLLAAGRVAYLRVHAGVRLPHIRGWTLLSCRHRQPRHYPLSQSTF